MHQWYVVQVVSGQEKKVKKSLEENRNLKGMTDLILEVLVPTENVAEVKKGQQKVTEKKVWPGYILIHMLLSDDSWDYVTSTGGVLGFIGGGRQPVPLKQGEVEAILQDMEDKKGGVVHKHDLNVGDRVKINDGVFINFIGSVIEVHHDKGRLSVMVSIFGRETRVDDLEFWQVEKLPPDSAS